jgi:hypothetical protein
VDTLAEPSDCPRRRGRFFAAFEDEDEDEDEDES